MNPFKSVIWISLLIVGWFVVSYAQETTPTPKPGETLKIQGEITKVDLQPAQGPPTIRVKTSEGKQYLVQVGPMSGMLRQGFNPKVGDQVTVAGFPCCMIEGTQMLHSTEIVLGGKTYSTPMGPGGGPGMGGMGPQARGGGPGPGPCWQQASAPNATCCSWWQ